MKNFRPCCYCVPLPRIFKYHPALLIYVRRTDLNGTHEQNNNFSLPISYYPNYQITKEIPLQKSATKGLKCQCLPTFGRKIVWFIDIEYPLLKSKCVIKEIFKSKMS